MGMTKMTHVNIYGPKSSPKPVLEALAQLDCFDPDDAAARVNAATGGAENVYEPVLQQAVGILTDLGADATIKMYDKTKHFTYKEVKPLLDGYAKQIAARSLKKTECEAKLTTYAQTKTQLYHLTNLHSSMDEIFSVKYLKVRFGRLPDDSYVKLPFYSDKPFTFKEYDFDGKYHWGMYFVPEDYAQDVDDIFASLYFERMWVPDFVHGTPQDALAQIIAEESETKKELEAVTNMSDIATPEQIAQLQDIVAWLNYEKQIFDMQRYVIVLEHSYYISGYVPTAKVDELKASLEVIPNIRVAEDAATTALSPAEKESMHPPVELKNCWFVRPFEMFVKMYGLPGYGDIDPTTFVAITYSILFGIMFGDLGQGVVLCLVGYFIMYKMMHLEVGLVLTRCSIFSVIFGFLYGSVFGFEHALDGVWHMLGFAEKPLEVLSPESTNFILISSIVAGVFIIALAIITGIASNLRRKVYASTIFSVNGLAGLIFYLALVALLLPMLGFNIPFIGSLPYIVLFLVIPFISIYFAEPICKLIQHEKITESFGEILINGFFDMFDALLTFASNTMSFLRVGGFVLAHAGMMSVVFTLAGMTTNVVVYAIIVIIGNIFVMCLEGLFVAIQVLRLEFYEIFSRFFEADGVPFTPLHISVGKEALEAEGGA